MINLYLSSTIRGASTNQICQYIWSTTLKQPLWELRYWYNKPACCRLLLCIEEEQFSVPFALFYCTQLTLMINSSSGEFRICVVVMNGTQHSIHNSIVASVWGMDLGHVEVPFQLLFSVPDLLFHWCTAKFIMQRLTADQLHCHYFKYKLHTHEVLSEWVHIPIMCTLTYSLHTEFWVHQNNSHRAASSMFNLENHQF